MTICIPVYSRPRLRGAVSFAIVLALACKKEDDAPAADPAAEAASADPDAAPEKVEKADPAPAKEPAKDGGTTGAGKGGIAALAKGLIDEAKAAPGDPLALVPASAVLVAQVQWLPFKLVPGWEDARAAILREVGDGEEKLRVFRDCELDIEQMQSVTFAMVEGKHGLAIVNGPGFGVAKNHECAIGKLRGSGKEAEYELADHEGAKRLVLEKGDTFGYFLADDSLLVVDKEIDAEVAGLREGKGTSVKASGLQTTIARVDTTRHAWFASRIVDFMKTQMGASPMGEVHEMWGSAHYEGEMALKFGSRLNDAAAATSVRDQAQKQLDEMKSMLPMLGVSAALAAKITFGAEDDRFTVDVSMTEAEMASIRTAIKGFM